MNFVGKLFSTLFLTELMSLLHAWKSTIQVLLWIHTHTASSHFIKLSFQYTHAQCAPYTNYWTVLAVSDAPCEWWTHSVMCDVSCMYHCVILVRSVFFFGPLCLWLNSKDAIKLTKWQKNWTTHYRQTWKKQKNIQPWEFFSVSFFPSKLSTKCLSHFISDFRHLHCSFCQFDSNICNAPLSSGSNCGVLCHVICVSSLFVCTCVSM